MTSSPPAFAVTARRRPPILPAAVLAGFLAVGVLAPYIAPSSPTETSLASRLAPPVWTSRGSAEHPLGTDQLGRDVLSRMIHGARISLVTSLVGILVGGVIGTALGLLAGYYGRWIDTLIMRLADMTLAIHAYLVAVVLAVVWGPGFMNVVVVVAFLLWSRYARQVRGEVLSLKAREFVAAAGALGGTGPWIMRKHILPNLVSSLVVLSTLQVGWIIVLEATLSFLGAGIPPPKPSWGVMVADGRAVIASAWWVSALPGLTLLLVVLSVNLVGDAVRDLLDPRLRRA